jgi:DNA-binding NtrC family response regulator
MSYPFVVLMVEDDHATLSLLAAIARREGFDARLAEDGNQAMAILNDDSARVDAMVLDLLLPGTNGFDILLHCKKEIPALLDRTIVITAASEQTYHGCEELRSVRRFYRKPLDFVDLTSALHACRAAKERDRADAGDDTATKPREKRFAGRNAS